MGVNVSHITGINSVWYLSNRFSFGSFRLLFALRLLGVWLESVAAPGDRDNLGVVEQAIENGAGGGYIAKQFAPFFNGSVRSHHGGAVFVAAHNELQEDFRRSLRGGFSVPYRR